MLTRRFQAALKEDMIRTVRRAVKEIKTSVSDNQVREGWSKNKRWYKEAKGNRVPPQQ